MESIIFSLISFILKVNAVKVNVKPLTKPITFTKFDMNMCSSYKRYNSYYITRDLNHQD